MKLIARKISKGTKQIYYVRYQDDIKKRDGDNTKIVRGQRYVSLGTRDKKIATKLFEELRNQHEIKNARRRLGIKDPRRPDGSFQ